LIFLISSAALPDAISDAQSLRAAASQSMKWLTKYFDAEAMIVSRCKSRRRLFADAANLRESIGDHSQLSDDA